MYIGLTHFSLKSSRFPRRIRFGWETEKKSAETPQLVTGYWSPTTVKK